MTTATAYNGVVNTLGEWVNISTLTEISFIKDTIYSIQIQNQAWLKVGENGVPFLINSDKMFPWKAKENTSLYIRTPRQALLTIDTDTGFFLNKNGGGGGTATYKSFKQKDIVDRNITETTNIFELFINVERTENISFSLMGVDNHGNVSGCVASGFASGEYMYIPDEFNPEESPFEIVCTFKTGNINSSDFQCVMGGLGSADGFAPFYIQNGKFVTFMSSNGTSWDIASATQITTVSSNTNYKMKVEFTGEETGNYNWYIWENNDWSLVKTITSDKFIYNGFNFVFGNNRGTSTSTSAGVFGGTIDLSGCYINIDGELWWQGATAEEAI